MEQWWERNKGVMDGDVVRGGYTKNEIEDFTGCIPLFLDSCIVNEEINLEIELFAKVYSQAINFEQKIKSSPDQIYWNLYATLLLPSMT
jgi:hypothetical protein